MTQYDDDYDYTATGKPARGASRNDDDILDVDLSSESFDDDLLDDGGWDDPALNTAQPRKAMRSGKSVKKSGKKPALFNLILIGGAVIAGLGILFFQFSGDKNPAPDLNAQLTAEQQLPAPIAPDATAPPATDPNDLLALQNGTVSTDPNAPITTPAVNDPTAIQPAPAPTETGGVLNDPSLMPETLPAPTPAETPAPTPAPVATETAVTPEALPTPAQATLAPASIAPTPAETLAPAPATVATETKAPTPAAAANMTSIPSSELDEMRKTIAALEAKVKDLESKPATVTMNNTEQSSIADQVTETPKKKPAPKKKKPAVKKQTTAKAKTTSTPSWELRGIAGGEAVVAKRGSDDFQTVGVGDTLSGVGRVTAIHNEGGTWVIEGTNGKIRQ